jgi:phosphorylase kinase alpha/beta subunit
MGQEPTTISNNVWVRDNMFLALSLYATDTSGEGTQSAVAIVNDVAAFFLKTAARFDDVIGGLADANDPMNRPHVRFNGAVLEENEEFWNHKQNDALGYFIWMRCRLCADNKMRMTGDHLRLLGLMLEYLIKIEFWQDEDAGHWEGVQKIEASSVGAVVAAAKEFKRLLDQYPGMIVPCCDGTLDEIEERGDEALEEILPKECAQRGKERAVDSALLFLVYPLNLVNADMARTILKGVEDQLVGKIGIRRYNGDSYWCKDYKERVGGSRRAFSQEELMMRDKMVVAGQEAQWCIFDPILSAIYGTFYAETRDWDDLQKQQFYLCRSLAQITGPDCSQGAWLLPECYYLCKSNWVPSDNTPLLWTQANMQLALFMMDKSIDISGDEVKNEFKRYDIAGMGSITLEDLCVVLQKLNADLPVDDLAPLLGAFAKDGKVNFESLIDGLFCGQKAQPAKASHNLRGLRPLKEMSPDEVCEAERVATDALLEMHGDFEGEYYPLPRSQSFPAKLGGMTKKEEQALQTTGFCFKSKEVLGRGVFINSERDMAVLINSESHLEIVVKPDLGDPAAAPKRLRMLENVLRDQLKLSGYDFA